MFQNNLIEPQLIQNYTTEYLQHINRYVHLNRTGIFCRYFNIDKGMSSIDSESLTANDTYYSGIRFNLYEYTPTLNVSEIIDSPQYSEDLIGQMYEGSGNVIIFTIVQPKKDDLIMFPYKPMQMPHIFRVNDFRVVLQSTKTTPPINIFELVIDYAPIKDIKNLDIVNQYVYNLILRQYMLRADFQRMQRDYVAMTNVFKIMEDNFFDKDKELYFYITGQGDKIYPLKENSEIYHFLSSISGSESYFHKTLRPFGIKSYGETGYLDFRFKPIDGFIPPTSQQVFPSTFDGDLDNLMIDTNSIDTESLLSITPEQVEIFVTARLIQKWKWAKDGMKNGTYPKDSKQHSLFEAKMTFDPTLEDIVYGQQK